MFNFRQIYADVSAFLDEHHELDTCVGIVRPMCGANTRYWRFEGDIDWVRRSIIGGMSHFIFSERPTTRYLRNAAIFISLQTRSKTLKQCKE